MSFDSATAGTPASEWSADERMRALPELSLDGIERVTVIAPHPDDETLGAGGLIALCASRAIPVDVIVVTDGGGSHPESASRSRDQLVARRSLEVQEAVNELAPNSHVQLLAYPDGESEQRRDDITRDLERLLPAEGLVVAPWPGDGHHDHRVVGQIVADLVSEGQATLLQYPIWLWHWASPGDERTPWGEFAALPLSDAAVAAKRNALALHRSQVEGLGAEIGDEALLASEFLEHFEGKREIYITSKKPLAAGYFDDLYERGADPWRLATRWYEERKRAITVASLPDLRFGTALEIGCSIGTLTAELAGRCDAVLAIDISAAAVEAARTRTAGAGNVTVRIANATTDLPEGPFDLVVLSEVGYYLESDALANLVENLGAILTDTATLVACHWRHSVDDYPLDGDDVHRIIGERIGLDRIATHVEDDFVLDVYSVDGRSVAEREGFFS